MKIVFTPTARDQFLRGLDYIRRDKPSAAIAFRRKAETILLRLGDYPDSGRSLPEFPESLYREVIVTPYRFFYRVKDDVVWVVAVWHSAQLPDNPV
jgi:plasmid stabilization system protein ParE